MSLVLESSDHWSKAVPSHYASSELNKLQASSKNPSSKHASNYIICPTHIIIGSQHLKANSIIYHTQNLTKRPLHSLTLFTHSSTHSLTLHSHSSLTHLLTHTHSSTHTLSHTHSFTHLLTLTTHSLTHSYSLSHSLSHSLCLSPSLPLSVSLCLSISLYLQWASVRRSSHTNIRSSYSFYSLFLHPLQFAETPVTNMFIRHGLPRTTILDTDVKHKLPAVSVKTFCMYNFVNSFQYSLFLISF